MNEAVPVSPLDVLVDKPFEMEWVALNVLVLFVCLCLSGRVSCCL